MTESKNNALYEAIECDDVEAVRSLLDGGADPNAPGKFGRTMLGSTANEAVVALLLAHGADTNLPDALGWTPLDVLTRSETSEQVIEMLMKAGADPHRIGPKGSSTFTYICQQGDIETIRTLIRCGADVNRADSRGFTPLQAAKRRPDVQALLRAAGAKG
jgi:ankyrin repeat protein